MDDSLRIVSDKWLEKIDKLFEVNVGEYIALPQLVVVGSQSSGKSSVLQGLTGLPFPRDSGLCTRFATQIIFRRASETRITVSIIPDEKASPEYIDRLRKWHKANIEKLDPALFREIMKEVTEVMGLGSSDGTTKHFSRDVLRIELSGLNQQHFSVIDVPGIFEVPQDGRTTEADMELVKAMVHEYMSSPRSIMLPVIAANSDTAIQGILQQAKNLDKEGIRTLGVLTKPDIVDQGSEHMIVDILEGNTHALQLGWHIVKNPGQAERAETPEERLAMEKKFFSNNSPWCDLDKDQVGADALRIRLQDILADHIRREFPKVKSELNAKLQASKHHLQNLGPKRQTTAELNAYMMEVSQKFRDLAKLAARSDYSQSDLFERDILHRLATIAVLRGEEFADVMAEYGHAYCFDITYDKPDEAPPVPAPVPEIDEPEETNLKSNRTCEDHPDLIDLSGDNREEISPAHGSGIIKWLEGVYSGSRGFELGTFDTTLLATTMRHQAAKWKSIALGYISDMMVIVHRFVWKLLEVVAPNKRVQDGVKELLLDKLRAKYVRALEHTKFLLQVELEGTPATLNHYFNDNLEKCRKERLSKELKPKVIDFVKYGEVVRFNDIMQNNPLSNSTHTVREIHDILRSYYKVARKRFVDCVRMQVSDFFLVTGPDTPLTLFSPTFVAAMSPAQLEDVASEEPKVKNQRAKLEKAIKQLEEGNRILSTG